MKKYVNGVYIEMTQEEIDELNAIEYVPTKEEELQQQIDDLTACLLEMSEIVYQQKGCVTMMAMLWANQIMLGKKTYAQVPRLLKEQVKEILIDAGYEELVTE